jgi:hypothetical protein
MTILISLAMKQAVRERLPDRAMTPQEGVPVTGI